MTTLLKPNQPIHFKLCDECECLGKECIYQQPFRFTDRMSFQLGHPQLFLEDELLQTASVWYGSFEDGTAIDTGYWSNVDAGGTASWVLNNTLPLDGVFDAKVTGDSDYITNSNAISIESGHYYRMKVLHSEMNSGCELHFYIVGVGYTEIAYIEGYLAEGYWIYDFIAPSDALGIAYRYVNCDGEVAFHIDNVSLKKYTFDDLGIWDCCDETKFISTFNLTDIIVTEDAVSIDVLLSDYITTAGMYKICLDDFSLIENGRFDCNFDGWDQDQSGDAQFTIDGGAYVTLAPDEISELLSQEIQEIPANCEFTLIIEESFGIIPNADLHIYINGSLYQTIDYDGSTESITISMNEPVTNIGIKIENFEYTINFIILNIEIRKDICSECFDVQTLQPCSLYLTATNTANAFGFDYSEGFTHRLRIFADLKNFKPEFDQINTKSSHGVNSQIFADLNRVESMKVYLMPYHILQALEVMLINDDFKIYGTKYIKAEGSIEYDHDKRKPLASALIDVIKANQPFQNDC